MRKLLYLLLLISMYGCNLINPSIMLKTGKDFKYDLFKDTVISEEYKISPNDIIEFRIFANDGFKLIDLTTASANQVVSTNLNYLVEYDGNIKLPILGRINIGNLTIRQAERMLEERYSNDYKKPFVLLKVTNRRVIIFPGLPGSAKVITLSNNTTLIEALALAGGISENGKARKLKLIRGNPEHPKIYLIDLSTIDGIKQGEMVLQSNDIIYVEPKLNIASGIIKEITPFVSILTTLLLVFTLFAKK